MTGIRTVPRGFPLGFQQLGREMGDIGPDPRRIEVIPATKPVRQPMPEPEPVKTPEKEPVPA